MCKTEQGIGSKDLRFRGGKAAQVLRCREKTRENVPFSLFSPHGFGRAPFTGFPAFLL